MNQPPDPYQQNPQPGADTPNSVPPLGNDIPYEQPGATPYPPGYNQPGNHPPSDYPPQPPQRTTPQRKKTNWIIGGVAVAVILIIAVLLIRQARHGFHSDPSSGWLRGSNSAFIAVNYIHWTNQNGQLNGSWVEYCFGQDGCDVPHTDSYPLDGTYNYQNQTVALNVQHSNGDIYLSFTGNIAGNTMTLYESNLCCSSSNSGMVFHSATQQDFKNAIQGTPIPTPSY